MQELVARKVLLTGLTAITVVYDNKFSILETITEKIVLPYCPSVQNTLDNIFIAKPFVSTILFCLEEPYKCEGVTKQSLSLRSKIGINFGLHCAKSLLNMNGYNLASTLNALPSSNNVFLQKLMSFCHNFWMLLLTPERITALTDFTYRLSKCK